MDAARHKVAEQEKDDGLVQKGWVPRAHDLGCNTICQDVGSRLKVYGEDRGDRKIIARFGRSHHACATF